LANNKTLLITGCNGQVGRSLSALDWPGYNVVSVGRDELDLVDVDQIKDRLRSIRPDVVINAAAYTAVDLAENEQHKAYAINAVAPGVIAQILAEKNGLLVHYSTDYVFSGESSSPYRESDETNPNSVYGCSKLLGEQNIQKSDCRHLILRTSWVYSEFGKNFLLTMLRLANQRPELRVVNDQIGCPTYAGDLAQLTKDMLQKIDVNVFDQSAIYHLGNTGSTTWYDFTCAIMDRSKLHVNIVPVKTTEFPTPAKRPAYSVLDKSKIEADFSLAIPTWKDGLERCLQRITNLNAE